MAWDQLELPWFQSESEKAVAVLPVSLHENDSLIRIFGKEFDYVFDKNQSALTSMVYQKKEMLKEPFKMNVWRAPLGNEQDQGNSRNAYSSKGKEGYGKQVATEYYSAGIDKMDYYPISIQAYETDGKVILFVREIALTGNSAVEKKDLYIWGAQSNGFENLYVYTISGDGTIHLKHTIYPQGNLPLWLPRIGLTCTLNPDRSEERRVGQEC